MRAYRVLLVVLAAVLVAGCDADVTTTVTPSGDAAPAEVVVTLTGEAADTFADDPKLSAQLTDIVTQRSGSTARRDVTDDVFTMSAPVTTERADDLGAFTGAAVVDAAERDGVTALTVELMPPTALIDALEQTPDPSAVPLLLENTTVTFAVRGEVAAVAGVPDGWVTDSGDGIWSVTRPVSAQRSATVTMEVTPTGSSRWSWLFAAAAAVAVTAAAVLWSRRRS